MSRRVRFGSFELDVEGPRLMAGGRTVKIQPQPLRVLTVLVRRAGDLVTRDELRAQIWDDATFVEFDQGLNYCIRQVRVALGDDAVSPNYVETVKGQGYRFVAAVDGVLDDVAPGAPVAPAAVAAPPARGFTGARLLTIAAVVVATVGALVVFHASGEATRRPAPALEGPKALTDFADSALAPALSPDGSLLAFVRGSSGFLTPDDIYVKPLPDGDARPLSHDRRLKYGPVFSPDGSQVAYTVMENQGWSTYTVPVAGGEPRRLLSNAAGLSWIDEDHLLFAEIRGGQHMGFVSAPPARDGVRDVYFPAHERAMAHYAAASPDRRSALIVEMNGSGEWAPCRLVALAGGGASRTVGPSAPCFAAAWSPDGQTMYFNAPHDGRAHLWRQRAGDAQPEVMTNGAGDELGIAIAQDGRSLITSMGVNESTLWLHTKAGERQLSFEGEVVATSGLSADDRSIYYVLRRASADGRRELHRHVFTTGEDTVMMPGTSMREFDIAPDSSRIVFMADAPSGSTALWIADLEGRSAPRRIGTGGEHSPFFGPNGEIVASVSDGHANFLVRWNGDEAAWTKVVPYPISEIQSVSPGRRWAMVIAPLLDNSTVGPMAVPLSGGDPVRICEVYCHMSWASDGRTLYVSVEEASVSSPGRALAIPVGPHEALPAFPSLGLRPAAAPTDVVGAISVDRAERRAGRDRDSFAYVRSAVHHNLFRLSIPD